MKAKSRGKRIPGEMNKTEKAYADLLDGQLSGGLILDWKFESVRLVLGKRTTYTPDFMVTMADYEIRFVEVKGFWRDDARVKIKVAAEMFPQFYFVAVQKTKDGWKEEEIEGR